MRFKTKCFEPALFLRFVQTFEKIHKQAALMLSPTQIRLVRKTDSQDDLQVFSGMGVNMVFEDYHIESQNNNMIGFEINLENLVRALKSAQNVPDTQIKLTKKAGQPVLSFCMEMVRPTQSMAVVQDIPVTMMTAAQQAVLVEPDMPDPTVYILMPRLVNVSRVMERLKNMSDKVTIHANMNGCLRFQIKTETLTLDTFYNGLEHPQIQGKDPPKLDESVRASAKVSIKRFARCLHSQIVGPSNVILCIVEGRVLMIHVLLEELFLTYFVPVLPDDDDE